MNNSTLEFICVICEVDGRYSQTNEFLVKPFESSAASPNNVQLKVNIFLCWEMVQTVASVLPRTLRVRYTYSKRQRIACVNETRRHKKRYIRADIYFAVERAKWWLFAIFERILKTQFLHGLLFIILLESFVSRTQNFYQYNRQCITTVSMTVETLCRMSIRNERIELRVSLEYCERMIKYVRCQCFEFSSESVAIEFRSTEFGCDFSTIEREFTAAVRTRFLINATWDTAQLFTPCDNWIKLRRDLRWIALSRQVACIPRFAGYMRCHLRSIEIWLVPKKIIMRKNYW